MAQSSISREQIPKSVRLDLGPGDDDGIVHLAAQVGNPFLPFLDHAMMHANSTSVHAGTVRRMLLSAGCKFLFSHPGRDLGINI